MHNKVVVITGASGGIGAALAQLIGKRGGKPVLVARREKELHEAATKCGPHALPIVADVTWRDEVQRVLDTVLAQLDHVDVWVNNAGRGISRSVAELTDHDFDEMMLVNVKSALYGMQTILPHFKQRGTGHIINISSLLGRLPYVPLRSAYTAAKHALNALNANLRQDLRGTYPDIHVSLILPGAVATDFGNNALHGGMDSRKISFAQTPEEVAEIIVDVIDLPRAEVYTRPMFQQQVAGYYSAEDIAAAEEKPPFFPPAKESSVSQKS